MTWFVFNRIYRLPRMDEGREALENIDIGGEKGIFWRWLVDPF